MTAPKKPSMSQRSLYKIAAAAANEVVPSKVRIRITLGASAMRREHQAATFSPSSIDIPEFSMAKK